MYRINWGARGASLTSRSESTRRGVVRAKCTVSLTVSVRHTIACHQGTYLANHEILQAVIQEDSEWEAAVAGGPLRVHMCHLRTEVIPVAVPKAAVVHYHPEIHDRACQEIEVLAKLRCDALLRTNSRIKT